MKLSYENSVEDVVAFARHHYRTSPAVRRTLRISQMIGTVAIFAVVFLLNYKSDVITRIIPAALFSAVYFFACPYLLARSAEKQVRRMFDEGMNNSALVEHELETTDEGIIEKTATGEQLCKWGEVEKIEIDGMRTFIYVAAHMAHIIPRIAVETDDYEAFMQAVRQGITEHSDRNAVPDESAASAQPTVEPDIKEPE